MVAATQLDDLLIRSIQGIDPITTRKRYLAQDEFLTLSGFLPPEILTRWDQELEGLKPHIHRNYIPKHKKGGSVGFSTVSALAPWITNVYRSNVLLRFLQSVVDAPLKECPDADQHRCALYAYTEAGDHIGFHYDTSYYKDRRWTLLIGLQDRSSSKLCCHLHTRDHGHPIEKVDVRVEPGMLVLFNGDKVYHAVTAVQEGESRFIVSMQFVTSSDMNPFMRFVSNMKDSIAYFGLKEVFWRRH